MALRDDILTLVKDSGSEEAPLSSNTIVTQLGGEQNKITGAISNVMKTDPFLHRKQVEEYSDLAGKNVKIFAYWYDATKKSDYYKALQRGDLPQRKKRGDAGRAVANTRAPASSGAPIFAAKAIPAQLIGNIIFIQHEGRPLFCALDNFKSA